MCLFIFLILFLFCLTFYGSERKIVALFLNWNLLFSFTHTTHSFLNWSRSRALNEMKRYLNTVRKESSQFFSQSDDTRHNDEVEKKETTVKKIFFHFLLLYVASRALRRDKLSSTFLHFISLSLSFSLTHLCLACI
jgi:hypothetical protein